MPETIEQPRINLKLQPGVEPKDVAAVLEKQLRRLNEQETPHLLLSTSITTLDVLSDAELEAWLLRADRARRVALKEAAAAERTFEAVMAELRLRPIYAKRTERLSYLPP